MASDSPFEQCPDCGTVCVKRANHTCPSNEPVVDDWRGEDDVGLKRPTTTSGTYHELASDGTTLCDRVADDQPLDTEARAQYQGTESNRNLCKPCARRRQRDDADTMHDPPQSAAASEPGGVRADD